MPFQLDTTRLDHVGSAGRRYVDEDKMPCSIVQVTQHGEVVYRDVYGFADVESQTPIEADAIFRIFSMTKPITSVALMQLHEQGLVFLDDPVSKFIPEFADTGVFASGDADHYTTVPLERPVTVKDLLTHTAGLTYGFTAAHPVQELYRRHKIGSFAHPKLDLEGVCVLLGSLPLVFQPGANWEYGLATDVVGRVIEVASGMPLDRYLADRIFEPLEMVDTGFSVDRAHFNRLTSLYTPSSKGLVRIEKKERSTVFDQPLFLGGGGGLASTLHDYQQFCDMLLGGGELRGQRILGRRTVDYMMTNHLPGGRLLNEMDTSTVSETSTEGMGFGLGFSVLIDPAANGVMGSVGEAAWGGAASTAFWVDREQDISCIFLTQLLPSSTYPIRRQLRTAVYQALV